MARSVKNAGNARRRGGRGQKVGICWKIALCSHAARQSPEKISFITLLQFSAVLHCATLSYILLNSYILLYVAKFLHFATLCYTVQRNFICNLVAVSSRATLKFSQHCISSKTPSSLCSIVIVFIITVIAIFIMIIFVMMIIMIIICVI